VGSGYIKKVLVAGGASFDSIIHLPSLPESIPQTIRSCIFHKTIGSTGTGKAINLSKLGLPTTLYALIGNDIYGGEDQIVNAT
jgi:sugar/nucleoside kinase (ribokinase family)